MPSDAQQYSEEDILLGKKDRSFSALRVFITVVIVKLFTLGIATFALYINGDSANFKEFAVRWPRVGQPSFASHFMAWDGAHYQFIADEGYIHNHESCAFYPLWPALMSIAGWIGIPIPVGALILANLLAKVLFQQGCGVYL